MVLSRLSEAGGRGAGGFLGGIANNPGVIIIVLAIAALVLFRGDISKAFGSFGENFGKIQLPSFPDITFPTIEFPDVGEAFGEAGEAVGEAVGGASEAITDFFGNIADVIISGITPGTGEPIDGTDFTTVGQAGARTARGTTTEEEQFTQIMEEVVEVPQVVSRLPGDQVFGGGGISFEGGFIFENPIDTLTEVLAAFPQLTASQAADFLSQFSGILPSELAFIDPDIKNIVANIEGENVQVPIVTPSLLEQEAIRAACTSCELFNLNCEQCRSGGGFA